MAVITQLLYCPLVCVCERSNTANKPVSLPTNIAMNYMCIARFLRIGRPYWRLRMWFYTSIFMLLCEKQVNINLGRIQVIACPFIRTGGVPSATAECSDNHFGKIWKKKPRTRTRKSPMAERNGTARVWSPTSQSVLMDLFVFDGKKFECCYR